MTTTPNLSLNKPAAGDASWDTPLNANADTLDAQFAATGTAHSHNGTAGKGPKLAQSATHESPDTDVGPTSLHHTLGTGAGQAAAGNHTHTGYAQTANNLSDLASAATARTNLGLGTAATHASGDYEPALGNPGTDGYVLSSTAAGVRSWAAPGTGGGGDPASATHAATSKATPVDADELPLVDSAASNALKKLTWANVKATLKTYFDTLYAAVNADTTGSAAKVGGVAISGTPSAGQVPTATSGTAATWQTPTGGSGLTSPLTTKGDLIAGSGAGTAGANLATVALRTTAAFTASGNFDGTTTADKAFDENAGTFWYVTAGGGAWVKADLGAAQAIVACRVYFINPSGGNGHLTAYKIQYSADNSTWADAYSVTGNTLQDSGVVTLPTTASARYWRLLAVTAPSGTTALASLQLHTGTLGGQAVRLAAGADGTVPVYDSSAANGIAAATPLKVLASATVGTTQSTIAHSLGYTPTIVVAQMTSAGQVWRSAAPDATNIYLTADAAGRTCLPLVR